MLWAKAGTPMGGGHTKILSGEVTWCSTCGAYADAKAIGLTKECKGHPKRGGSYGGAWGQLRKLLRGVHPRNNLPLPDGIDERGRPFCPLSCSSGVYINAIGNRPKQCDSVSVVQPPSDTLRPQTPTAVTTANAEGEGGKNARQKMQDMLARVRMKEAAAIARRESLIVNAELTAAPIEDEVTKPPRKLARQRAQPPVSSRPLTWRGLTRVSRR